MRTLVFDTDPQTLVTIYDDGRVTVAVRSESWHAWGPPHKPIEAQVHITGFLALQGWGEA